jgi:hypothetical protein
LGLTRRHAYVVLESDLDACQRPVFFVPLRGKEAMR